MQKNKKNNTTPNVEIFSFGEHQITVIINAEREPLFVASDVCKALEQPNISQVLDRLDDNQKLTSTIWRSGQNRQVNLVTESGLYTLIMSSRKSEAKTFQKWVTEEVLPSIRKNGYYMTPATEKNELLESVREMVERSFEHKMDTFITQYVFPAMQKNQADVWRINTDLTKQLIDLEVKVFDHLNALPQYKPVEANKFVCYLYVLQKRFTNEYKIGKSIEPVERKFVLELGGADLDVLILIKIPSQELGLLWESLLQKTFEEQSIGREWYILAPYQIEFMRGLEKSFEILNRQ